MLFNSLFGYDLIALNEITLIIRLITAVICGGVLGLERTIKRRPAGIRTYILVCMGSSLVMMTSQFINQYIGQTDPTRLGAQVINGIGFIGAGTILMTGYHQIKGLTTAAAFWTAACMGLAIGAGFYLGAIITCLLVIFVMTVLEKMQTDYLSNSKRMCIYVIFKDMESMKSFMLFLKEHMIKIDDFNSIETENKQGVGAFFMLKLDEKKKHADINTLLSTSPGVVLIEEI